ncbi:hypothetical protein KP509_14G039700 [Ceratopteris richardii]|uniref:Uncharacterized protein n=1 Tax=Ceratopteris richardii TaxID=49495 RepID=A0A8T2TE56_CERRI|nr:hypothetical protein KP509_14G039700 [Ceratopteris richardii]
MWPSHMWCAVPVKTLLIIKNVQLQGSSVERQQEIPQQPTSPCTLDLSLAHLRENYSTSSLFSQEFKLGLGPSINSCKPSTASRNCPQTWNPDGGMLHCKSNNETFEQHSIHKRVSETARHKEVEACLGTGAAIRGINVLNGSVSPSVFINASRPGSCDQLSADASSTSSFASAHAIDDSSQAPVNTIPQTQEYNMDGGYPYNPSSSVSQIQRFPLSNVQYSNALIDYSSKDFSTSGNSNLPHYKTAIQPVQSNHSVKLLERTVTDIHMLPGNELNTEDGNTFSAGGLVISANACVSGQSKSKVDDKEKLFSTNDSFQILPDGAQESSGGEHKQHISLETAMLSVNAMNQRAKSYLFQSPRMQHITSNQNNAYKEAETSYEKNPYMANISYSNNGLPSWQAEVSEQASDVSSLPFRQVEVSEQASDVSQHKPLNIHTHHAKFLNVHTSEVIDIGVNLRKPPSGSYSSVPGSAQSQLLRHLSVWKRQTSAGVAFDTMSRICPASNTACSHEVSKCSLLPGKIDAGPVYSDKFPSSQHFTGSQFPAVDVKGSGHHTTMERHNSCSSDNKRVDVNQSVDASSELLKSATVPMVSYSAGVHHCPSSNELKHKPTVPPHESNSSKEDRALSVNNQGPLSLEDTCKEEGSKILAQSPIVIPRIVGPLSPSKISISYPAKKRKRQHSVLIPWHVSAAEAINAIPSNSDVEAMWASALNRLSEKDSNVTHEDNKSSVFQVKRRLKLTTQSMQQLFQPIRDGSSHGTTFADKECDIYIVAKMALEDACRLVAKTNRQAYGDQEHPFTTDMFSAAACDVSGNHPPKKFLKRFMERFQHLGGELARLDCTASASELCSEMHELEQLSIVDRLARHHGLGLVMDTCNDLLTEHNCEPVFGSRKAPPERYVTAIAMPRILPTENTRCLPL